MPHRMVLIADPQLVDPHTYPRRGLALAATIFYTDQFMSRSYNTIQRTLAPMTTLFLGDLFDGGREWSHQQSSLYAQALHLHEDAIPIIEDPRGEPDWKDYSDDYWMKEYMRFLKIFPSWPHRRTIKTLPGNHDLGIGNGIREGVRDRFRTYFGEPSSVISAGNHTVILLDSVSLSNDNNPTIYTPARDFLDSLPELLSTTPSTPKFPHAIQDAWTGPPPDEPPPTDHHRHQRPSQPPTILLTHVPLYRPPETPCGPTRESKSPIAIRAGYQYQNVLTPTLSTEILDKTQASYVFSGDDHDACVVAHKTYTGHVREVTVKSFSLAMGIRRPGFYMVSLYTTDDDEGGDDTTETVQGKLCLLPSPRAVWTLYIASLTATIIFACVHVCRKPTRRPTGGAILPVAGNGSVKKWPQVEEEEEDKYSKKRRSAGGSLPLMLEVVKEVGGVVGAAVGWYVWLIWWW